MWNVDGWLHIITEREREIPELKYFSETWTRVRSYIVADNVRHLKNKDLINMLYFLSYICIEWGKSFIKWYIRYIHKRINFILKNNQIIINRKQFNHRSEKKNISVTLNGIIVLLTCVQCLDLMPGLQRQDTTRIFSVNLL